MESGGTDLKTVNGLSQWALSIVAALLAVFTVFRQFFLSGGRLITGDVADGRLILCIHEHWHRFLQGKEGYFDLGFYYPEPHVLGYSDTFLLTGILHAGLRFLGLDMFLAFQLVQIFLCALGFAGMLAWLRHRKLPFGYALFGTVLFIVCSPVFIGLRNSHIQLQAVWLVPWILLLAELSWAEAKLRSRKLALWFFLLCSLYGLMAYSTFYIGWFLLLFAVIWVASAVYLCGLQVVREELKVRLSNWPRLVPGLITLSLLGGLFLWTYLPVRQSHGGRSIRTVIEKLPYPWDLINHSDSNLLWGKLNTFLYDYPPAARYEMEIGSTPLLTLFVLVLGIALLRRKLPGLVADSRYPRITALAVIISFILLIKIWYFTLWAIPFFFLPGGDGVRVAQRYNVLLMVPMSYLAAWGIAWLRTRTSGMLSALAVPAFGALLLIEQIQLATITRIDRHEQLATLASLPEPPEDATAFFAYGTYSWAPDAAIIHNAAILYSQHWNLPTVNGRSGLSPKDWMLSEARKPDEHHYLLRWANARSIQGRIYFFDTDTLTWQGHEDFPKSATGLIRPGADLMHPDAFSQIAAGGWSVKGPLGIWNDGSRSVLRFPAMEIEEDVDLVIGLVAFVHKLHPKQRLVIRMNGEEIYRHTFSRKNVRDTLRIPFSIEMLSKGILLEFSHLDARSPASLGLSEDTRKIGVGISALRFDTKL